LGVDRLLDGCSLPLEIRERRKQAPSVIELLAQRAMALGDLVVDLHTSGSLIEHGVDCRPGSGVPLRA
jgi:hypothetical protein